MRSTKTERKSSGLLPVDFVVFVPAVLQFDPADAVVGVTGFTVDDCEHEVEAELAAGNYETFETMEDFLKDLR